MRIATCVSTTVALTLIALVVTSSSSPRGEEATGLNTVPVLLCTSKICNSTAKVWKANIKNDVDPCDDFYSYACGNFGEHNELPGDKGRFTSFDKVAEEVKNLLIARLSKEDPETKSNALKFVWSFFKKTTDQGKCL